MKRYISYFAVLLAVLLGAACSKDDSAAGSDNRTGVMAMTVSTRQTADTGEYDPLQHQTVYIYNDEGGLLRKYTSKEACPERLELLAGTYRVAVEAGEEAPADFTKRLYKGEETFTVKPGETTNVAVVCQIVNTVVEVKFDDTIAENLAPGYSVWIAGGEKVDEEAAEAGSVPALRFTAEGTGYYTLPAGMTSLAWLFRGTHVEGKNVEMEDYIPNVKAGGKYTLTFKYSPDLPGYIDCVLISVDPDTDDKDDEIIFSPDPAVISEGFDITEIQKYRSGEKKYRIMAFSELTRFTVSVGDKSYDALNGTTEGIFLEPVDKYNVRLTLSDAFFASCQAGDQKVTLRIEDANGGSSEVATTYRLEGLVPVTADDYDLWANTVTLRVVSFTPGTTVQFGLRSSGGEWQPMAGTSQGDDFITATYAPQWEEKTTADWSTPARYCPIRVSKRAPAYRQAIRTTTKRRSARRNSAAGSRPLRAHPCPTEAWNRGEAPSNSRAPAPTIPSGAAATTRSPRNSVPVTRRCRAGSEPTVPNCPRHIIRWPRFPHRATYSRETSPSRFSAGWAATSLSAKSSLTTPAREPSGSNTTLRSGKSTTISTAGKFPSAKWTRPGYSSASWTGRPNRKYLPGQKPRRAPGIRRHKPKRPTAPSSGMPPNSSKKRPRAMKW